MTGFRHDISSLSARLSLTCAPCNSEHVSVTPLRQLCLARCSAQPLRVCLAATGPLSRLPRLFGFLALLLGQFARRTLLRSLVPVLLFLVLFDRFNRRLRSAAQCEVIKHPQYSRDAVCTKLRANTCTSAETVAKQLSAAHSKCRSMRDKAQMPRKCQAQHLHSQRTHRKACRIQ